MPSRVFRICDAYESGFGHGLAGDGAENPYPAPDEFDAYNLGYAAGQERAREAGERAERYELQEGSPDGKSWILWRHVEKYEDGIAVVRELRDDGHRVRLVRVTREVIDEPADDAAERAR
jgi:hypothetical protein